MSKFRFLCFLITLLALVFISATSQAERPAAVNAEIEYLLQRVEQSGGRFIRDGKEYSPTEAVAHLRKKLGSAGDRVKTTSDFIDGIATKSYLSGQPYYIQIGGERTPTGEWLKKTLAERTTR